MKLRVGFGRLSWNPSERVSDRYGTVSLWRLDANERVEIETELSGMTGRLIAVIKGTRKSGHIGDIFRCISPSTPAVGDEIVLGVGTVFYSGSDIGLEPQDGRQSDWLDPRALYRCHDQTVELVFEKKEDA